MKGAQTRTVIPGQEEPVSPRIFKRQSAGQQDKDLLAFCTQEVEIIHPVLSFLCT